MIKYLYCPTTRHYHRLRIGPIGKMSQTCCNLQWASLTIITSTCVILFLMFAIPQTEANVLTWAGDKFKTKLKQSSSFQENLSSTQKSPYCDCSCGVANEDTRIVGGGPSLPYEYPWMVRLSYFNRFYCGGTLINDKYVVTAAHCVKGFLWFLIKVTLGEHDRCNQTTKPETRFVLRVFASNFSFFNFDNDIAVLRLNDRVPITDTIRPICLPKIEGNNEYYEGKEGKLAGWGTLEEGGKPACILRVVDVPIINHEKCALKYPSGMVTANMMCAGYDEGKKDSCQGDSGGPLMVQREDKRFELAGVVSWGNGCARPNYPGVYTTVSKFLEWIENNSKDGCYCTE